ncbi:hypothetical protein PM082_011584 [Marasmius tenuissimus]|nr:hypothetical protein PM082_011584 [Marasmius tenuissimus]
MASTLIVGAGASGLALALSLLKNGVPVRIIEKRSIYPIGQRGSGVHPRTLELYKILGILSDIEVASGKAQPMRIYTSPEGPAHVAEANMVEPMENTPEFPIINGVMLGQDRHEAILRKHLADDYNTHVELGTELKSFVQTEDHVESCLVKQVDGKEIEEVVRTKFLVGADGARGAVRKQLGLTFLGESHPQIGMVVGDLHIKSGIPDRKYWRAWGDQKSSFLSLRPFETDDDRYSFLVGGTKVDIHKVNDNCNELFKHISSVIGRDIEFGELIWSGIWTPNIRMVDKFGQGRVFVCGDAAHVHSPTGGQGMNSGVQDAINLGWKMGLVRNGLAPLSLLQSYTDERLPIIATMLNKTTEIMNRTFQARPDIQGLDPAVFKRGFELRMLGVNYRGSPLVVDENHGEEKDVVVDPYRGGLDGALKGGDRAPAATGLVDLADNSITTLYDLFSPSKHTILVFAGEDGASGEVLENVRGIFPQGTSQIVVVRPQSFTGSSTATQAQGHRILVDKEGYAFKHYHANVQLRMFAIRPDGFVGAIAEGVEGLKKYAGLIFEQ